jgi:hypothetical protein
MEENNTKELDYSRIKKLGNKLQEFLDTLPNEMNEENGMEILLLAHDIQNKVCGTYLLVNGDDERESLVRCIDTCVSGAMDGYEKAPLEWELVNGFAEYIARICALYPSLYENFKNEVEKYKNKNTK